METTCSKCGKPKSDGDFNRDRTRKYGRDLICRECNKKKCAAWKVAHKPKKTMTLEEMFQVIGRSFKSWTPEQQEQFRKETYEGLTGKPYVHWDPPIEPRT
jgi:hypothetical protein